MTIWIKRERQVNDLFWSLFLRFPLTLSLSRKYQAYKQQADDWRKTAKASQESNGSSTIPRQLFSLPFCCLPVFSCQEFAVCFSLPSSNPHWEDNVPSQLQNRKLNVGTHFALNENNLPVQSGLCSEGWDCVGFGGEFFSLLVLGFQLMALGFCTSHMSLALMLPLWMRACHVV